MRRLENGNGRRPVYRLQCGVAQFVEFIKHDHAHRRVVFHHQQCLAFALQAVDRQGLRRLLRGVIRVARQIKADLCALPHLAVNADVAAGLLGKAVDHRQPQTGALPNRLGGKKRLEHARQHIGRHPDPGIRHRNHRIVAGLQAFMQTGIALVKRGVGGAYGQRAAVGHGVAGIDGQVQHCAFELVVVAACKPYAFAKGHHQFNMLAQRAAHQLFHGTDQAVDVHRFALQ